jgi:hypothetical protein
MDLLILLVENDANSSPAATSVDRLWGKDVFVDVESRRPTRRSSKIRQVASAIRQRLPRLSRRREQGVSVLSHSRDRFRPGRCDLLYAVSILACCRALENLSGV